MQDSSFMLFLLASRLTAYPEADALAESALIAEDEHVAAAADQILPETWERLVPKLSTDVLELASDYIDIFDRGKEHAPPYEAEYGNNRAFRKANELADIAGFYQAYELKLPPGERPDHISVELEFYAQLLIRESYLLEQGDREGVDIIRDTQAKFLADHLGRFTDALAAHSQVATHPFFGPVFTWVAALVKQACQAHEVIPEPIDWRSKESEPETVECGACPLQTSNVQE